MIGRFGNKATRRALFGGLVSLIMLVAGCSSAADTNASGAGGTKITGPLNIMLWEGYGGNQLINAFEAKYHVRVNVTYINSNDEVFGKIRTGSGQYCVVPATTDVSAQYINDGLVQPINLKYVPNYQLSFPAFQHLPQLDQGGVVYGVPHTWSADPIIYNASVIKNPRDAYKLLFDKQYAGKISMYNDISTMWVGAEVLGYNPFNLTSTQMTAVEKLLLSQKPMVRKYWVSGGDLISLFQSGEVVVAQGWNYMYTELRQSGVNVGRLNPPDNLGWVDSLMIPKGCPNTYTAELWINWALSGQSQAATAIASGYSVVNPDANKYLTAQEISDLHMNDPNFVKRIVLWRQVNRPAYEQAWNSVLAG